MNKIYTKKITVKIQKIHSVNVTKDLFVIEVTFNEMFSQILIYGHNYFTSVSVLLLYHIIIRIKEKISYQE